MPRILVEACSKCLTETLFVVEHANLDENWLLCPFCHYAFDCEIYLLREFMKPDFGTFPISSASRDMINSRKRRALGDGTWTKKLTENVQEESCITS